MGKKYFCEYCEKSMADNYESRKKHLNSGQHKLLVRLHYNQFRDYKTLIEEEGNKKLCLRSLRNQCPFEENCYNTHFTPEQLREIEFQGQQLERETVQKAQDKVLNTDLSEWFKSINSVPKCFQNNLTHEFHNTSRLLAPSLQQTTVEDVRNMELSEWG